LFERPILAFQTLTFIYGSQQPLHQDSAYVRVSSPLELVASWIALEDIEEGSGELVYYPGSHRLPEHLFHGQYKWAPAGSSELEGYAKRLEQRACRAGLTPLSFRPRKGDVLIWSADLIHGGAPRSRPDATRRSIVTHYCPTDQRPAYFPNSETNPVPGSKVDLFTSDPALKVQ
jgi:ectoine hydroxylase-related dioxygenase (phytanoyl-CoA dioxygenase family)